jgi:hypothetical protein
MSIAAIALSGLGQVHARVQASAERLAKLPNTATQGDTVDLSAEIIALAQAKHENAALLAAIKTDDEMTAQTLNILA